MVAKLPDPRKSRHFVHAPGPSSHTDRSFSHMDGPGPRSPDWREAVSSGRRGPYLQSGSLRSDTLASAGACRIEVKPARALPARMAGTVGRPPGCPPAAFDPQSRPGRPPAGTCSVTANAGLTSPCRVPGSIPSDAGWEKAVFGPRRFEHDETAQGSRHASREGKPASRPEGAGIPHRWGAGLRAKPHSPFHHGPLPAPHESAFQPDTRLPQAAGDFLARGVLGCGGTGREGKGREGKGAPPSPAISST